MSAESKVQTIFGSPIYTYSRGQALDDGLQIDVSGTSQEVGIRFPVFLTRAVWDAYVEIPELVEGQDIMGRLWDILWMLRFAISGSKSAADRIVFSLHVRNDNRKPQLTRLIAVCGPCDHDDPSPAITVMMPTED